jgi:hypothetical protein
MSWRIYLRCLPLALLLLVGVQRASADTIEYTFQGSASGSIGNTSFTNAAFTITLTANTNNISEFTMSCSPSVCTIYDVAATSATITVDGVTSNITSAIGVYDNQGVDMLGLARITGPGMSGVGMDLLDLSNPAFATYNLSSPITAIGPDNLGTLSQFSCSAGCVITGLGNVSMTSASQVTFNNPVTTPEPSTPLLLVTGLLLVAGIWRTGRARTRA